VNETVFRPLYIEDSSIYFGGVRIVHLFSVVFLFLPSRSSFILCAQCGQCLWSVHS